MRRALRTIIPTVLIGFWLAFTSLGMANPDLAGSWVTIPGEGTPTDPWGRIYLDISIDGEDLTIKETVGGGRRTSSQVYPLKIGKKVDVKIDWWTANRHIGAYIGEDKKESIKATWIDDGEVLRVVSKCMLRTSQGETPLRTYAEYRVSTGGKKLTVIRLRSSRDRPLVYVFERNQ